MNLCDSEFGRYRTCGSEWIHLFHTETPFPLDTYPEAELSGHILGLFIIFGGLPMIRSAMDMLMCILPTEYKDFLFQYPSNGYHGYHSSFGENHLTNVRGC